MSVILVIIAITPLAIFSAREAHREKARFLEIIGWSIVPCCLAWIVIALVYDQSAAVAVVPLAASLAVFGTHQLVDAHRQFSRPIPAEPYRFPTNELG